MNDLLVGISIGSSRLRAIMLLFVYTGMLAVSLWVSYELRFDFDVTDRFISERYMSLAWIIPFKLCMLYAFGQFSSLLGYFRMPDLVRLLVSMIISALFLILLWMVFSGEGIPPRAVILTDLVLSVCNISAFRIAMRILRERYSSGGATASATHLIGIVGAGDVGAALAADLLAKPGLGMRPVVFMDWKMKDSGIELHGIPVAGSPDDMVRVQRRYNLDKVIIALDTENRSKIPGIVSMARENALEVEVVPSLGELSSGRIRATQIRQVQFEDLLGRDQVALDNDKISDLLKDKVVIVTGAGGSIGSELTRQIARCQPSRLVLLDHSEIGLFRIEQELLTAGCGAMMSVVIADIRDESSIRAVFDTYKPEVLFHAAAYKHVPMMEVQPSEAILNNSIATARLAEIASDFKLDCFVFISTDKAINPTSVMGVTKRISEVIIKGVQKKPGNETRFVAVRFGNVLGSSGSVIPTFKKQIAAGGPVTVTHPDVTRYFMTIPEASGLVLESAAIGEPGEILVLDMGDPIKIVDVAKQLIKLSGLEPEIDILIQFTGLRPGEKLHEELQHTGEMFSQTIHPSIYQFRCESSTYEKAQEIIVELLNLSKKTDKIEIKRELNRIVPEYKPYLY